MVSNDTSFEEMRWTLMQTPQEQWNAVSAKKLAEANEKFQKFTQVGEGFVSPWGSTLQLSQLFLVNLFKYVLIFKSVWM